MGPAARHGEHSRLLRRGGEPAAGAALAAALFRRYGRGLPARPAARVARGALSWPRAGGLARRIPARARGGAARRRRRRRPRSARALDRAGGAVRRDARLPGSRRAPLPAGPRRDLRRVLAVAHTGCVVPERRANQEGRVRATVTLLLALVGGDVLIAAGTHIPIRFLEPITSGRDTVGTPVLVQTMGALVQDSCVVVPPYLRAKGRVVVSKGGGRFGRHGKLGLAFDSLEVRPGHWLAMSGVLDTLEYAKPNAVSDSGLVSSGRTSVVGVGKKLVPAGVAAAGDPAAISRPLVGGAFLVPPGVPLWNLAVAVAGD